MFYNFVRRSGVGVLKDSRQGEKGSKFQSKGKKTGSTGKTNQLREWRAPRKSHVLREDDTPSRVVEVGREGSRDGNTTTSEDRSGEPQGGQKCRSDSRSKALRPSPWRGNSKNPLKTQEPRTRNRRVKGTIVPPESHETPQNSKTSHETVDQHTFDNGYLKKRKTEGKDSDTFYELNVQ